MSQSYEVSWSLGPLILGAKYEAAAPSGGGPVFSYRDATLTHHWFGDASTANTTTCAGHTYTTNPYTTETDLDVFAGNFAWSASIQSVGVDAAIFTGLTLSGEVIDTSGLGTHAYDQPLAGCLRGFGSGECRANTDYCPGRTSGSAGCSLPVIINYDLSISKYGKHPWTGALLRDELLTVPHSRGGVTIPAEYPDGIPMPFTAKRVYFGATWDTGRVDQIETHGHTFNLDSTWAAAQDPPLPAGDMLVPIQGAAPTSVSGAYNPVQLTLAPEIEVHRPDGNRPSDYVSPDAKIAVSEGATETTFTVALAGGTVTRTLDGDWLKWLTKGGPAWDYFNCRTTKHDAGKDVFSWNSYGYMDLVFRCPVATTLEIAVGWTKPEVTDSYQLPMSERRNEWDWTPHTGTSTYTVVLQALPGDDQTVRINLLYPDEGGPAYLGRVDTIALSGLVPMPDGSPATVVLKNMTLKSAQDGEGNYLPYYLKMAPGPPVQRGSYAYVGIAHDGSSVTMEIPDTAYKWDEITACGGNLRYCEPLTSNVEGVGPLDTQADIGTIAMYLDRIEGITATYDASAYEAACSDGDTTLGHEYADWLVPTYPVSPIESTVGFPRPGVALSLPARPMCRKIWITNGIPWTIRVDHALMGGIEAVVHEDGAPVEAGAAVQACYVDEDGVEHTDPVASGVTDACGYVVVAPVPANGSRVYQLKR